jgi:hypothetical protein
VDVDAPDPDEGDLALRLGEPLSDLGIVRLDRRGWPSVGNVIVTSTGLLFAPVVSPRSNGAVEQQEKLGTTPESWSETIYSSGWWPWNSHSGLNREAAEIPIEQTQIPIVSRMLSSPGALFVERASVKKIAVHWNRIRIERYPARSVTLVPVGRGNTASRFQQRLRSVSGWGR